MKQMSFADAEYASKRKTDPQGIVPDRDGSGCAMEGFDCLDRAALPKGRRRPTSLSADGDAACPSDAKLVRL